MFKATIALAAVSLAAFGAERPYQEMRPTLRLKEEKMSIEYTATANEAVIVVEGESETALESVEILMPDGMTMLELHSKSGGPAAFSGFVLETQESTVDDLIAHYGEGRYDVRARAMDGAPVLGGASLSHALLPPPVVLYPYEGAIGVPSGDLKIFWIPDPAATAYTVSLEQGENDGLTVRLPADSKSLHIPKGILFPDTETQLEIGVTGANGNRTLVEIEFRTM